MGFSRQEYWSGLPRPPLGNLLNPGIEPRSPALQVDSVPAESPGSPTTLEWVAYPSLSRCSPPRNQTGVSCIAGRCFNLWATIVRIRGAVYKASIIIAASIGTQIVVVVGFYHLVPAGSSGKEPTFQRKRCKRLRFDPWVGKIP